MAGDQDQLIAMDELLTEVERSEIYTKIDIAKAFWQVVMSGESQKFTGFCFRGRTCVFKCIPFGFKVARAKFTRGLRNVLGAWLLRKVKIHLDDILIHCSDEEEHLKLIEGVIQALEAGGVTINPKKCSWIQRSVKLLGPTLDGHKICIEEETKEAITNFRTPTSKKTVQPFLGRYN